jgi:hypothetical protein
MLEIVNPSTSLEIKRDEFPTIPTTDSRYPYFALISGSDGSPTVKSDIRLVLAVSQLH